MSPEAGRFTDRQKVFAFLKQYKIKIALQGWLADLVPKHVQIHNYENYYMTDFEFKSRGFQAITSANLVGISSLQRLEKLLFYHPTFGVFGKNSNVQNISGCEFCFLIAVFTKRKQNEHTLPINLPGPFHFELTCMFPKQDKFNKCPRILREIKQSLSSYQTFNFQYPNTPSCDANSSFKSRYFAPNAYEKLVQIKKFWDPHNKFNHCQSVGNDLENCCPV